MNLKELIKEVKRLKLKVEDGYYKRNNYHNWNRYYSKLQGIKQTIEAVENWLKGDYVIDENSRDWNKLKKLLK